MPGFTLTVRRPGARGKFGARSTGTTHPVPGCIAAPAGSSELNAGETTVLDRDTIYGPYEADVQSQDIVTIPAGQPIPAGDYEVDGTPARWADISTGAGVGCVIKLVNPNAATTGGAP